MDLTQLGRTLIDLGSDLQNLKSDVADLKEEHGDIWNIVCVVCDMSFSVEEGPAVTGHHSHLCPECRDAIGKLRNLETL